MNNASLASASKWSAVHPGYSVKLSKNFSDRFRVERDGKHVGTVKRVDCGTEATVWIAYNIGSRGQEGVAISHKTLSGALSHLYKCAEEVVLMQAERRQPRPISGSLAKLFLSASPLVRIAA